MPVKTDSKILLLESGNDLNARFYWQKTKKIMLVRFLTEQILYFLPQLQPKSTFSEKKSQLQKSTARAVVFDISESTARAVPGQLILEDEKKFLDNF